MALNIKDERAISQLRQLAALTGRSMNKELRVAIDERLHRVERESADRLERLLQLAAQTAEVWPPAMATGDPAADLYDETGLPA